MYMALKQHITRAWHGQRLIPVCPKNLHFQYMHFSSSNSLLPAKKAKLTPGRAVMFTAWEGGNVYSLGGR